jgi:hypothetical protein
MSDPNRLSPDGRWRWDGTAWVPVGPAPARRLSTGRVTVITAGSIVALLLVGTGLAALTGAVSSIQSRFAVHSGGDCLPSDFPTYQGATRILTFTVGPICSEGFTSTDGVDQVTSFYQAQLSNPPWVVTGSSTNPATIMFARQDRAQSAGEVQVFPTSTGSRFTITYSP